MEVLEDSQPGEYRSTCNIWMYVPCMETIIMIIFDNILYTHRGMVYAIMLVDTYDIYIYTTYRYDMRMTLTLKQEYACSRV